MDEHVNKGLEDLADSERVSVSFLVNKNLRKYLQWDHLALKYGSVSVLGSFLRKLMSYLSDEEVKDLAKWSGDSLFKEYVIFWFKNFDAASTLKAIRLLSIAGNFEYEEAVNGNGQSIIIKHNQGRKWSMYYEELFRYIFSNHMKTDVNLESSEDQVLIQIPNSKKANTLR